MGDRQPGTRSQPRRTLWCLVIWLVMAGMGLAVGEAVYRWAGKDFHRVKQISFMLANVDSVAHAERLVAESEQLRPAWRWPWSDEVHFGLERGPYLVAGALCGAVAGLLAGLIIWGIGKRRKPGNRTPSGEGASHG